ncbi:uncharacterized protein [Miscanthus floridulus]|uniref:uncharacterized protein isoform X2 n=1 Tax=Miscanthus floridulus TaxID=154761 RepID=UPI00345A81E1
MPSPPTKEGSDVPTMEIYVQVAKEAGQSSGQEVLGGARVSASTVVAVETRPTSTCCVCTAPWSCSGAHRIWSCLEKWLGACGNTSAKCPQCGAGFEQKHIINIYTPGDLFDGCSCMQEVETHYSEITKFRAGVSELIDQHASEDELEISKVKAEVSKLEIAKAKADISKIKRLVKKSPVNV